MNHSLPTDIFYEYYLDLDLPTLSQYCQVDSNIRDICRSEKFWRRKLEKDFPYKSYPLNKEMAKQIYIDAYQENRRNLNERSRSQQETFESKLI